MQWDNGPEAGFTTGKPWLPVNPNHTLINAAEQVKRPDSVFHYYQKLIALRKELDVMVYGHYELLEPRRYLARPVLVHAGQRYVGGYSAFDIVPGMKITGALQVFTNREGLSREFSLLHWSRKGKEHLFLAAVDHGSSERRWLTHDIGPMMRITKPTISIMPDGIVVVFHRNGADSFVRSEFWSLPDALEFHSRQSVLDPETAGQTRVQQMYKDAGGVKPADRPWWKFW
jgi:hypothetical protein